MVAVQGRAVTTKPVARWDIINTLLDEAFGRRYLEIGVQAGRCGSHVRASEKWGVDPAPKPGAERLYKQFFRLTSNEFFDRVRTDELFDVVFIDGLHEAQQVLRDTDNALQHLAPGGYVVLHDCNPDNEIAQRVPRETGVWNGDCWKAMVALRQRTDVDAFTVDTDYGVGVVRKKANEAPLQNVPAELTYAALETDRERLLGLVPPIDWRKRLGVTSGLGRIVVVSAILERRDNGCEVPRLHDVDDYVMFTDGRAPQGWRRVSIGSDGDPRQTARRIKTLALELDETAGADIVVWIDGRIKPTGKALRPLLVEALKDVDIAAYPHPWRACAYAEAHECARLDRAPADALQRQTAAYEAEGFPRNAGLLNTMVVARRRTDQMVEFGRAWWSEIQKHTQRDQVSLPYLLWKHGVRCGRIGADVYRKQSNPHFERGLHRGQRV
jgi:hypothetical protein